MIASFASRLAPVAGYRHAKSTSCHTCERGTYSSAPGAAYCRPCPRRAGQMGWAIHPFLKSATKRHQVLNYLNPQIHLFGLITGRLSLGVMFKGSNIGSPVLFNRAP